MSRIRKGKITVLFWIYLFIVLRITVFRSTFTLQHLSILDISFYRTADNRVPLHLYVTASLPERENRFDLI